MKKIIALTASVAALAVGSTAVQAESRMERAEARVAELLEGRVAGEPQSCISAFRSSEVEVIPHVGVTYESGDTVYLARAKNPETLRETDLPVFERFGSRLCSTDVIHTVHRHAHHTTGVVFLEDFVPYRKG